MEQNVSDALVQYQKKNTRKIKQINCMNFLIVKMPSHFLLVLIIVAIVHMKVFSNRKSNMFIRTLIRCTWSNNWVGLCQL